MKIRNGFVSNSSTSSYICDICDHNECGSDSLSIREYGMTTCTQGHTLCLDHIEELDRSSEAYLRACLDDKLRDFEQSAKEFPESFSYYMGEIAEIKEFQAKDKLEDDDRDAIQDMVDNSIPALYCPLCNLSHITDEYAMAFYFKMHGLRISDSQDEIRKRFKSMSECDAYLKGLVKNA